MVQGTVKDNVRDELDEVAGRGRGDREDSKEATTEEVGQPCSGGCSKRWPMKGPSQALTE